MRKVAVTGGLSSGKSTVCGFLKELGSYVISADEIVHQLLSPETSLGKKILALLGHEVITNNSFDRRKIAKKIFNNAELLSLFEGLLHPEVNKVIQKEYQEVSSTSTFPLFVVEVPLLFEAGFDPWFDATISVQSKANIALERYLAKGGTKEQYISRSERLLSPEEKAKYANFILINEADLDSLRSNVTKIYHALTQEELYPK